MELGNLLWGNSRGEYLIDRDLTDLFIDILEMLGCDARGYTDNHSNENKWGGVTTENFIVRPYYWGEEEDEMTLHNFECKPLNLFIDWYKYPLRDAYSNIPLTKDVLYDIIYIIKQEQSLRHIINEMFEEVEKRG